MSARNFGRCVNEAGRQGIAICVCPVQKYISVQAGTAWNADGRAHHPEVAGSNPAPATKNGQIRKNLAVSHSFECRRVAGFPPGGHGFESGLLPSRTPTFGGSRNLWTPNGLQDSAQRAETGSEWLLERDRTRPLHTRHGRPWSRRGSSTTGVCSTSTPGQDPLRHPRRTVCRERPALYRSGRSRQVRRHPRGTSVWLAITGASCRPPHSPPPPGAHVQSRLNGGYRSVRSRKA